MDINTINGVIRALLPAITAYAVGRGWIPQSSVADISAAVVAIVAALWSIKSNTKATP